jgi:hypothetical protein
MATILTQILPYLEAGYFIANIALVIIATYGLKQITLLKLDMRLRNERAAKERAIEASQTYLNTYTALSGKAFRDFEARKLKPWPNTVGDFSRQSILASKDREIAIKRFELTSWLAAINVLESVAATYVSGVADEATGFSIIGRTFCATVEDNYDLISMGRAHAQNSYFESIVRLYRTWAPRLEREDIDQVKRRLDERSANLPNTRIPTIGDRDAAT